MLTITKFSHSEFALYYIKNVPCSDKEKQIVYLESTFQKSKISLVLYFRELYFVIY